VDPGVYNLVLRGTAQIPYSKDAKAKKSPNVTAIAVAPPIKLTVFKSVAEVSVSTPSVTVRPGTETELLVKVNRLHGYAGAFKVQLVSPSGFQGVSAAEVTIPAGTDEAKLVLKAADNAKPAMNPNVLVRATAEVEKVTLTHDAKVAVTIAK
jgi:hypothetical protein